VPKHQNGTPQSGLRQCRVCAHPFVDEINVMIMNGVNYSQIIKRAAELSTAAPPLTKVMLSRHKAKHLYQNPVSIQKADGTKETYISGRYLAERITVDKSAIPEAVPLPDALKVIINAGISNILQNPTLVSPQMLISALEVARKSGLFTGSDEEFTDAWAALGRKRRTRRMTLEETVEEDADEPPAAQRVEPAALPDNAGWDFSPEWEEAVEPVPAERKPDGHS
jgi:hypothetical protein